MVVMCDFQALIAPYLVHLSCLVELKHWPKIDVLLIIYRGFIVTNRAAPSNTFPRRDFFIIAICTRSPLEDNMWQCILIKSYNE